MGGKTTTSTNTVTIPKEVMDRYNAINTKAEGISNNPFQKYGTDASDFVAQMNEQQQKGISGLNAIASSGPSYNTVQNYLNPYLTNVADTTRKQMEQANEQAQSGALGTAAQSGAFGGDRAGVAAANLANQQNMAMGSTMANIYSQGFDQATNANMNDLNRMAGLAGNQLAMGTQMQQTEQAGKDALINQFQQEQGYPFQVASWLANIALGTGAQSGSTTTAVQPASFWSDRRLKHDIKEIGTSHDGMPIYTFKYKGDPQAQTHVGFMADEVEKKHPEAVGLDPSGYKTVNYDKATESMGGGVHPHHRGEAFASGGVAGPYGSPVGSQPGSAGYVPEGYLPVGDVMVADPNFLSQQQQGLADMLSAAAGAGKDLSQLSDTFGKNGKFYKIFDSKKAYGGGVDGGLIPAPIVAQGVAPQQHRGYLDSIIANQEASKKQPTPPQSAGGNGQQQSGLSDVASTLGSIATIASLFSDRRLKHDIKEIGKTHNGLPIYTFKYKGDDAQQTHVGFMADEVERKHPEAVGQSQGYKTVDYSQAHKFASGGVAGGRHGYQTDGAVDPGTETPVSPFAPKESIRPVVRPEPNQTPVATGVSPLAPTTSIRPAVRPQGLAAAEVPVAQTPVATDVSPLAPTTSIRPVVRPEGLGVATVEPASGDDAAREFFNTKMLNQESGNRQFDPKTGETIMSPKGAAGIAQVTKPTGPEAAALAGKEWDENRWLNDTEYNKAIGEAYFLHQYHKFGSLDKAAAAYNAGPGRLRRAMENAAIHGGSYMDYLPDETKNYIKATTGLGGDVVGGLDGGSRLSLSTMDGDQQPAGGVKPYEDRNWLGKVMHNPEDGSMNKDAMLSLFAGIGDMLSNPSPFLLPTIGAGMSGAANTYMARQGQLAKINETNIGNLDKLSDLYNKFMFTNPEYAGMTLEEFAQKNGLGYMLPSGGVYESPRGAEGKPITLQDTRGYVDSGDGIKIPFMNDYASLTRVSNEWKNAPEGSPQRRAAEQADVKIKEIEASGYTTGIDEKTGQTVNVPVASARARLGAALTDQQNVQNTQDFRTKAAQEIPTIGPQMAAVDRQANIYSTLEAGALAEPTAQISALARALGINYGDATSAEQAALVQEALKEKARGVISRGGSGESTDFAKSFIDTSSAGPSLQPDAIKKLLVIEKSSLMRQLDHDSLHQEWQAQAENPYDVNEYEKWFAENHPLDSYTKGVEEKMPVFAGETGSEQKPYPKGTPPSEIGVNRYFTLPDGSIGQRQE